MEVIQTIDWGLKELGHDVTYGLNQSSTSSINIIFGAQVLPIEILSQFPQDTIVYNLEQLKGIKKEQLKEGLHFSAKNFKIWEYSLLNSSVWSALNVNTQSYIPIGYTPILTRIPKFKEQDIDVLIYGMPGQDRLNVFWKLAEAGLKILFVCGMYGQERDDLIARSKIVLNVNLYNQSKIFEIVRVSYLLANKKAVVAIVDDVSSIESDISSLVKLSTMDSVVDDCIQLLADDRQREKMESDGFEIFRKRDIRDILSKVL